MSSYYWQDKEVETKLISLSSSALVDETGVERGPASFSDGYGWQVNNKHVATNITIQER